MSRPAMHDQKVDSHARGETEAGPGVGRRDLIANADLAGAAVVAAHVVGRAVQGALTDEPPYTGRLDEPLVARLQDPRTGVIDIFFGEEHIVLRDPVVAARLAKAVQ
jgi:hypothetical protein